jgi:hypothetical protein
VEAYEKLYQSLLASKALAHFPAEQCRNNSTENEIYD